KQRLKSRSCRVFLSSNMITIPPPPPPNHDESTSSSSSTTLDISCEGCDRLRREVDNLTSVMKRANESAVKNLLKLNGEKDSLMMQIAKQGNTILDYMVVLNLHQEELKKLKEKTARSDGDKGGYYVSERSRLRDAQTVKTAKEQATKALQKVEAMKQEQSATLERMNTLTKEKADLMMQLSLVTEKLKILSVDYSRIESAEKEKEKKLQELNIRVERLQSRNEVLSEQIDWYRKGADTWQDKVGGLIRAAGGGGQVVPPPSPSPQSMHSLHPSPSPSPHPIPHPLPQSLPHPLPPPSALPNHGYYDNGWKPLTSQSNNMFLPSGNSYKNLPMPPGFHHRPQ
ncbi:hypothetical protein PFISCL1PPCAC_6690, partial [Pristionchus fissidentatus]